MLRTITVLRELLRVHTPGRQTWIFLIVAALTPFGIAAAEPRRPNILFCFADDWGRYASCYREVNGPGTPSDLIQTPNIDHVAREGVLFRNAFVTAPSCTPCRSSLLSGQYFWRTRRAAILQGAQWDAAIPAYPLLLKESGYHIGKMYKVWSPGAPADAPYGGQAHAYQQAGGRFNQFSETVTQLVAAGRPLEASKAELYREVRQNFQSFLKARPADHPFCFWFGPTNVHRKWIKGSGKALWGLDPDLLRGKLPSFLPDVPEIREDFADYLGEAMAFDAAVGELIAELKSRGEWENTLVVISGDHGAPGFPYGKCNLYDFGTGVALAVKGPQIRGGRVVDDFVNLMDLAPTFLEAGRVTPPAEMTGRSLWPTLKSDQQGLVDATRTWVVTGRERHVAGARDNYLPYPQRALRTKDYLYIVNFQPERWPLGNPYLLDTEPSPTVEELTEDTMITLQDVDAGPAKAWLVTHRNHPDWQPYFERAYGKRPREELYVVKDDPDQVHNVAADRQFSQVKESLHQQLLGELTRTGDPRVTGDGLYFETPPLAGPVEGARGGPKKSAKKAQ